MHRICIYLLLTVFSTQLLLGSEKFEFGNLAHEKDDPQAYTLVCLDSSLIPVSHKVDDLKKKKEFNPVKHCIRKDALESLEKGEDDSKQWHVDQQNVESGGDHYYVVSLYLKQSHISASERLTTRLRVGVKEREINENVYVYSASMIIFPQSEPKYALAYLLGTWSQILNTHAVIHDWGLRLAASQAIFSDKNIKQILGKNNFDPNPTTRRERKQRLAHIETFALEVGTEGLRTITILPAYAIGTNCQRLAVGSDSYRFFLPDAKEESKGDTIGSLHRMASYLFSVYTDTPEIHPKLQAYVDEQEVDVETLTKLNERLAVILSSADAKLIVFPADNLWKSYGKAPLFSYKKKTSRKYLLDVLQKQNPTMDSLVSIKKWGETKDLPHKEPLGRIIYTLPISIDADAKDEDFYRFDCGQWFKVAPSRFDAIIRIMRSPVVKVSIDALLPYTLEDAKGIEGEEKGLYQEARYNRRVIAGLTGKKQKGILLDRLNIYFEETGNKFEFGDMLLYDDNGQYFIVHVKRREAGDIDHHRAQVERCSEYLATELNKGNAHGLLLQGHVNGLYIDHKVPVTKVNKQGKRLTHGDYFKVTFAAKKPDKKEKWADFLKDTIFKSTKSEASKPIGNLKATLKEIDLTFFGDHKDELIVALDTLYDCEQAAEVGLSKSVVEEFLEGVKQLIEVQNVLFPSGVLKEKTRKRIAIVMAVVDDRKIEGIRQAEKEVQKAKKGKKDGAKKAEEKLEALKNKDRSDEEAVFKKQQLWGLDRTLQLVRRHGFRFNLVVINENSERLDWDAFGSTKEKYVLEDDSDKDSNDEDSDSGKSPPKKGASAKKPGKKPKTSGEASDKDDTSEEDDQLDVTDLFKSMKKLGKSAKVKLSKSEKFSFNGVVNPALGIYGEYISCPTVGDGNCFFHATFTQDGEDRDIVTDSATVMRTALCDVVPADGYLAGCRSIAYEEYLRRSTTSSVSTIPEPMRTMFRENHIHAEARNYVQSLLQAGEHLPAGLALPHRHTDAAIRAAIPAGTAKDYMQRFRYNAGADAYIPVRPGMICPAEFLALQNNVRVNIFTFNSGAGVLNLLKSVGVPGAGGNNPISNILIDGIHYVALINPAEPQARKNAVIQIMKNAEYTPK